ncbi:cilia- and flagella-associated protein 300 [Polypterus senegalus]|uniref:cilia- and flagella-associated protein 300 n=1 Tax=Polypterus senegalus TaxID=55291 RepID=UPI0019650D41|nr:cilia- and flagella-associated protein 300 [Polypterus senegalus]
MSAVMSSQVTKFTFKELSNKSFSFLRNRHFSELLMKWSMLGRITAYAFSFDQDFKVYEKDHFVWDFFNDPHVTSVLKTLDSSGHWEALASKVTKVEAETVPCTAISLSLFDSLYTAGIVRQTGHIVKCFDEEYGESDELRKMLLIEDSENSEVISQSDRQEFIFQIFKHFCLGGLLCQYEDTIEPYLEITQSVYKDIVSVYKDSETKKLKMISCVFKVSAYSGPRICYPADNDHHQNFAYLVLDPVKRHVYVLHHSFGIGLLPGQ